MSNSFSTISGSFVASFYCKFLSVLRDDGHFFLSAIRRCSLVRILCGLGQQPVLTIEYLKGEFDFVPNFSRCGSSL